MRGKIFWFGFVVFEAINVLLLIPRKFDAQVVLTIPNVAFFFCCIALDSKWRKV